MGHGYQLVCRDARGAWDRGHRGGTGDTAVVLSSHVPGTRLEGHPLHPTHAAFVEGILLFPCPTPACPPCPPCTPISPLTASYSGCRPPPAPARPPQHGSPRLRHYQDGGKACGTTPCSQPISGGGGEPMAARGGRIWLPRPRSWRARAAGRGGICWVCPGRGSAGATLGELLAWSFLQGQWKGG